MRKKKLFVTISLLILLLIVAFVTLFLLKGCEGKNVPVEDSKETKTIAIAKTQADTIVEVVDSVENKTIADTVAVSKKKNKIKKIKKNISHIPDTAVVNSPILDSVETELLSDESFENDDGCEADTVIPWVYPEPSGGLHTESVSVVFKSSEECKILWGFKGDSLRLYDGEPIAISENCTLVFSAEDSCGNKMVLRSEVYEFKRVKTKECPDDMTEVGVRDSHFCIDKYEWPNRKGKIPVSNVSQFQAADSCFSVGKRLCTSSEWTIACSGPYNWKYPYGDKYEPHACVTQGNKKIKSGAKSECRGYFEIYDMSGNLAEWTSSRSVKNREFFDVAGGLWDSGPNGDCFKKRYSYYPQNRHNPVGFRCCKDIK